LGLAVNNPARRDKDKFFHRELTARFQHREQPQNIRVRVLEGVSDRDAHVHLGRMMVDQIESFPREDLAHRRAISNIYLIEARLGIEKLSIPRGKIIYNCYCMALSDIRVNDVRTNKSRAPRH
jgi:hypothetical protein